MRFGTVILFARAPRLGVGKRRLAKDIGRLNAARFYRRTLTTVMRRLSKGPWHLLIATSAPSETRAPVFRDYSVSAQTPGDLGHRMSMALRRTGPGPRLIIGSDIPGITVQDMHAAFDALRRADSVFGPAPDGGYWLVGVSGRKPIPADFMKGVRWSSPHALADTRATLPKQWRVALLVEKADVDDGASYQSYRAQYGAP